MPRKNTKVANSVLGGAGLAHHVEHVGFTNLDLNAIRNTDHETIILLVGDLAVDPAGGDDLVAGVEFGYELGVLLLFFALGGDDKEPHRGEHETYEYDIH